MKIVVDAMGGDFAPKVNVDGAIDALREYPDMDIILVGPQALVEETISAYGDARRIPPSSSAWTSFAARRRRRLSPPVRRAR